MKKIVVMYQIWHLQNKDGGYAVMGNVSDVAIVNYLFDCQ